MANASIYANAGAKLGTAKADFTLATNDLAFVLLKWQFYEVTYHGSVCIL